MNAIYLYAKTHPNKEKAAASTPSLGFWFELDMIHASSDKTVLHSKNMSCIQHHPGAISLILWSKAAKTWLLETKVRQTGGVGWLVEMVENLLSCREDTSNFKWHFSSGDWILCLSATPSN